MDDQPPPLVSGDIDLTGFGGFMLDVNKLLASQLVAICTPEEGWAALMLWCRAWQQKPHGSLPNDEKVLRVFAQVASDAKWKKLRPVAMRGFYLCSDGRYYHATIACEVEKAWLKRLAYRKDHDRVKKFRASKKGGDPANDLPDDETPVLPVTLRVEGTGTGTGTEIEQAAGADEITPEPKVLNPLLAQFATGRKPARGHDSWGWKAWADRQPDIERPPRDDGPPEKLNGWHVWDCVRAVCEAAGLNEHWRGPLNALGDWLRADLCVTSSEVRAAITAQADRMRGKGEVPRSLAVFDAVVRGAAT